MFFLSTHLFIILSSCRCEKKKKNSVGNFRLKYDEYQNLTAAFQVFCVCNFIL